MSNWLTVRADARNATRVRGRALGKGAGLADVARGATDMPLEPGRLCALGRHRMAEWKARVDPADARLDHINSLPGFHVRAGEVRKAARRQKPDQP